MARFKFIYLFIYLLNSCDWNFNPDPSKDLNPIARVGDKFLYSDDLILPVSNQDSSNFVKKQIDDWITNEIILYHAYANLNDKTVINNKIQKYMDDLVLYEYENDFISKNLNFIISDSDIKDYYSDNIKDFVLGSELVRCLYAKIRIKAPEIVNFRKLIRQYPKSNLNEIRSYCFQFAEKSFLDDSLWIDFDELIANTPFREINSNSSLLTYNKYLENSDENYYYFIKIIDYKLSGDISPLSFEYDIIRAILLNKRKRDLLDKLQDSIYLKSIKQVDYEIY